VEEQVEAVLKSCRGVRHSRRCSDVYGMEEVGDKYKQNGAAARRSRSCVAVLSSDLLRRLFAAHERDARLHDAHRPPAGRMCSAKAAGGGAAPSASVSIDVTR
jgi:hypothetical protein